MAADKFLLREPKVQGMSVNAVLKGGGGGVLRLFSHSLSGMEKDRHNIN